MSEDSDDSTKISVKKEKFAIIAVSATLILAIGVVGAFESQIVDRNRVMNMSATIEPDQKTNNTTVGINTGQELHFGNVTYDTNVTKFLQVNADRKSVLEVSATGNISDHIYFENQHYFMGNKTLGIKIGSKDPGYYEGKLEMNFQVPETRWGAKWISVKHNYF